MEMLSSGVEDSTSEGGVYMILNHKSMKRNSQRTQNVANLKMITSSMFVGLFVINFMQMALVGIFHH